MRNHVMAFAAGVLATLAVLSSIGAMQQRPTATRRSPEFVRQYYLSRSKVPAGEARSACGAGFHMAALTEVAEPSVLQYNLELGLIGGDSGRGPTNDQGWLHTAQPKAHDNNCTGYTSSEARQSGWVAGLSLPTGTFIPQDRLGVWGFRSVPCNSRMSTWCVQDEQ